MRPGLAYGRLFFHHQELPTVRSRRCQSMKLSPSILNHPTAPQKWQVNTISASGRTCTDWILQFFGTAMSTDPGRILWERPVSSRFFLVKSCSTNPFALIGMVNKKRITCTLGTWLEQTFL